MKFNESRRVNLRDLFYYTCYVILLLIMMCEDWAKRMQTEGTISKSIHKIANLIICITNKLEAIQGRSIEHIVVMLYLVGHMFMYFVHEPWFDEALAWLISRDGTLYELLFVTPHYEGHPALWHIILMPFAKLGAPYEVSLSLVSLIFSGLAMSLFIYKAPFKRIIRLTMPFTYYLFFQYGVISRPYCIMILAFVLMAMTFRNRNEKPGRFVLSLWLLCLSSAYGIVIAGGICIVWLLEMVIEAYKLSSQKNSNNGESRGAIRIFIEDKLMNRGKLIWLFGLLLYVIFILWRIIPAENAYANVRAVQAADENSLIIRLVYTVFASVSDVFLTNVYCSSGTLRNTSMSYYELAVAALVGLIILSILIKLAVKKKTMLHFIIPYVLFTCFGAAVYFYAHHIGIIFLFVGYWLWVSCGDGKTEILSETVDNWKSQLFSDFIRILVALAVLIPLYWGIGSCICDVVSSYGTGRNEYTFLEENGLENSKILVEWSKVFESEDVAGDYSVYAPAFSQQGVSLAPYFDGDAILNSPHINGDSYSYEHSLPNTEEADTTLKLLADAGYPEVILGNPDMEKIYGENGLSLKDYTLVFRENAANIRKAIIGNSTSYLYVRNDICEKKGLKKVNEK